MIVVSGNRSIHKKVWFYLKSLYLSHKKIVVIDAANRFDPYLIAKISLANGISPYITLDKIMVARAFTPFQLLKLLEKVKIYKNYPIISLGINILFEDENISKTSAYKLFRKCINIVKNIKGIPVITVDNEISIRNFIPILKSESKVFVEEEKILKPEIKNGEKKLWEGQLHHLLQY